MIGICGPSGSGKDSLFNLLRKIPIFNPIIKHTSRPRREYENAGADYIFVNADFFLKQEEWICISEFNEWFYGIHKKSLKKDKINLAVLDPTQIASIKSIPFIDLTLIYLEVPDRERIIRCLKRGDNIEEVFRRYKADREDFKHIEVINNIIKITNADSDVPQMYNVVFLIGKILEKYLDKINKVIN